MTTDDERSSVERREVEGSFEIRPQCETLRAAFVQAQAQIMNNGEYTPVVVIDKGLALQLLDEIDFLERLVMNVAMRCVREPDVAAEMVADERGRMQS